MRSVLFLLPGLGDALVAAPIVDAAARDGWSLDVVAMLKSVAEYARALDGVEHVEYFDLFGGPGASLPCVRRMRRRRYDIALLPFPATRWQYHALALAAGAKRLATHDYGGIAHTIDRMARGLFVPLQGGHRMSENVRLARAAGLDARSRGYLLPEAWRAPRIPGLLGVHPGTMRYKGNERRRWPLDSFIALVRRSVERGRSVRVFIGPAERAEAPRIAAAVGSDAVEIVDLPLSSAARRLSECEVFVGNDAGFAHLAAGLGVKTIVLYGMSDPVRSQPVGPSLALRPSDCPACHDEGMRTFDCVRNIGYRCIRKDLTLDDAVSATELAFASDMIDVVPQESGRFRLYGRPRNTQNATRNSDATSHTSAAASEIASGT